MLEQPSHPAGALYEARTRQFMAGGTQGFGFADLRSDGPTRVCHDVLVDGRRQSRRIPTLRLSGQWLAALGFAPGSKPHIAIVDGAMVVTPASDAKGR